MINQEFGSVADILETFPNEQSCINHLEQLRWEHFIVSPFDAASKVYKCPNNTYKCKNSGKYFNVKTGTIFHNSKVELQKWFVAIWLITKQNSDVNSVSLGKELNITQKTAWYIIKRIKSYFLFDQDLNLQIKKRPISKETSKLKEESFEKEIEKREWLEWLALHQNIK
jgi:transposase-like protein